MAKPIRSELVKLRDKANGGVNKEYIKKLLDDLSSKLSGEMLEEFRSKTNELHNFINDTLIDLKRYGAVAIMPVSENVIAVKIFNDLIMYLDPRDIAVVPHIALERIWEKEITLAWLNVLENNNEAIVFDVGANFGYYGMLASQRLGKKTGKVILFEPNPNLIPYIEKTLSVNWLNENTVIETLGISDKSGFTELNVLENYTGSSSMLPVNLLQSYAGHKMQVSVESVIKTPVVTIDEYCELNNIKRIDFMKIDIEGYEEKAYSGMKNIVKISPGMTLFIEFTKYGYEKPEEFYNKLLNDFKNIYTIKSNGELKLLTDTAYKSVIEPIDDLVFLVFSKKDLT
jgi:FkbM family methyltransferase